LRVAFLVLAFFLLQQLPAQVIPAGFPVLEESMRRKSLLGVYSRPYSFLFRSGLPLENPNDSTDALSDKRKKFEIGMLPFLTTVRGVSERPYGWGDYGMIPNPGMQSYVSGGMYVSWGGLHLTLRPELVLAQNLGFETGIGSFSTLEIENRFLLWNIGDVPERFGPEPLVAPWWGQSKLTYQVGAFEIGASTQNIWWGPGQWNSLTFSNNAQGFPHLTLNTIRPAKTFLGKFEGQVVMGKLSDSGVGPSQDNVLNEKYLWPFTGDWRYLNAITVSWNPRWINGLYLGFARTHHAYNDMRGDGFIDWFPIFEVFQKEKFFTNGNSVEYDANGRSQQFTIFGRWVVQKTKSEIYFEFGRRDHAYNWRDFTLSPEHARAYLMGFNQLIKIPTWKNMLQIRAEMTHQQESINRYIRNDWTYINGGFTWHTHGIARGFVNYGQPLGVGIGTGSNVQTLEMSLVNGVTKKGFLFERLANNQDYYYRALFEYSQRKPWVDYSLGFLYDKQFGRLLLSSKLQVIHARNYQWQLDPLSTPEFPRGRSLTSVLGQVSAVYFWNRGLRE
jgi:hypothetical protein